MQNKTATVYWLHLKEHTNILNEGYVGVTTRSINIRFKEHCSRYRNSYNQHSALHLAFATHGLENIIKTELYSCDIKEAYEIECILRPFDYIGWNSVQGGKLSPSVLEMIHRRRNAILSR